MPPVKRILLVDDEQALLIPIARYFRNLGCSVDMAQELEEAEALLDHRRYELVILDLCMTHSSDAGGLDVLRKLRKRGDWTSVIVLSAFISPEVEAEAVRQGADAVVRKPLPLAELAQLAAALIGDPA